MIQLEPESGRVMANGVTVRLTPRLFTVFRTLHAANGRCVPPDAIARALYGDRLRSPTSVTVAMASLRKRLAPTGCRIETLPCFGYLLDREAA